MERCSVRVATSADLSLGVTPSRDILSVVKKSRYIGSSKVKTLGFPGKASERHSDSQVKSKTRKCSLDDVLVEQPSMIPLSDPVWIA